jgi:flagellar hook assembly protein FlgD
MSETPTNTSAPYDGFYISKNIFTQAQPVSIFVSTTQSPGNYGLTIFNSAGEHIKTLDHLFISAPYQKSYTWDGKNKYGSTCASGVYVIYLSLPFKTVRARVIFLH